MSVGATLTVNVTNYRTDDASAVTKMDSAAIDITEDLAGFDLVVPPISDTTTASSPGNIRRVVQVNFGSSWPETYPDDTTRKDVLKGLLSGIIQLRVPAVVDSETVVLF